MNRRTISHRSLSSRRTNNLLTFLTSASWSKENTDTYLRALSLGQRRPGLIECAIYLANPLPRRVFANFKQPKQIHEYETQYSTRSLHRRTTRPLQRRTSTSESAAQNG